jgi:formyltetrahydrofolate-dependent phosphoribosylglycinamide formyltransferase
MKSSGAQTAPEFWYSVKTNLKADKFNYMSAKNLIIYTDGGSRGNPGPAAAGFVITDEKQNQLAAKGIYLGRQTNNYAEYSAILAALKCAKNLKADNVALYSDSELLVRQILGKYKVKSANLKELYQGCIHETAGFKSFTITHVFREKNKFADKLVNMSLDKKADVDICEKSNSDQQPTSKPLRIAVLISGGGTTLLNLADNINTKKLNAQIPLVISSRSTVKGVQRAKEIGLNVQVIRKKDYDDIDDFSRAIQKQISANEIDLVVQAGWLCLWKIPSDYLGRVMNIHPALLPAFGGQGMWGHHVHQAVIDYGCKISGCTVHFATNEYDQGPIIIQRCCPVDDDDSPDSLAKRVFEQECIAYPQAISLFAEKKLTIKGRRVLIK